MRNNGRTYTTKNMYFSQIDHLFRRNFTFNFSSFKCAGAAFRLGRPFVVGTPLATSFSFSDFNSSFWIVFFALSIAMRLISLFGDGVEFLLNGSLRNATVCFSGEDDGDGDDVEDEDEDRDGDGEWP